VVLQPNSCHELATDADPSFVFKNVFRNELQCIVRIPAHGSKEKANMQGLRQVDKEPLHDHEVPEALVLDGVLPEQNLAPSNDQMMICPACAAPSPPMAWKCSFSGMSFTETTGSITLEGWSGEKYTAF